MSAGVCLFGATGSVGRQVLAVLRRHRRAYHITALSGHRNAARMIEQCREFTPECVAMSHPQAAAEVRQALPRLTVLEGAQALPALLSADCAIVISGIVGAAGLPPILAAVQAGKRVLVANKEPLVMLGPLLRELALQSGASLLPLDSEHSALFQCLPDNSQGWPTLRGVRRCALTASGGPLLDVPLEQLPQVTPQQACAHPVWNMGRKISVDSATLMNKGLELIEACALFNLRPAQVDVLVHPQGIVHSLVDYADGSALAQLGAPDMRIPIAVALGWPQRIASGAPRLDLTACDALQFHPPEAARFPALALARHAAEQGGTAPALLNAANEVAVDAFLQGALRFDKLVPLVEAVLEKLPAAPQSSLETVLQADAQARAEARKMVENG